jgi:hypothetical protein
MPQGDKKRRIVVAVPQEMVKLSKDETAKLKQMFRSSLANVVSARGLSDDDPPVIVINNNRDVDSLMSEAVAARRGGGASKKGAKKAASKRSSRK